MAAGLGFDCLAGWLFGVLVGMGQEFWLSVVIWYLGLLLVVSYGLDFGWLWFGLVFLNLLWSGLV